MKAAIENLRGWRGRGAWFALPALALVIGTTGVVLVPARGLLGAERALVELQARSRENARERLELHALRTSSTQKLLARADEVVDSAVPPAAGELVLHTAVRLVAARAGLELASMAFDSSPEAQTRVGSFGRRTLDLRGSGTLESWRDFVAGLRELGQPCAVDSFSFTRPSAAERRFEGHLQLDLYHSNPALASAAQPGGETR